MKKKPLILLIVVIVVIVTAYILFFHTHQAASKPATSTPGTTPSTKPSQPGNTGINGGTSVRNKLSDATFPLANGSTGKEVYDLQRAINQAYGTTISEDGGWAKETESTLESKLSNWSSLNIINRQQYNAINALLDQINPLTAMLGAGHDWALSPAQFENILVKGIYPI